MIPRERADTPPDTGANMKGDDLRALLGRLERAIGPDRALDEAIHFALRPDDPWGRAIREGRALVMQDKPDTIVEVPGLDSRMSADGWATMARVPACTASLDAAVALLDRFGMSWSKSMEGFVCVHDREGAGAFRPDAESTALPIKLMAGMVRALIARTEPSPDA